jgi:hypothetical protein
MPFRQVNSSEGSGRKKKSRERFYGIDRKMNIKDPSVMSWMEFIKCY